MDDNDDLFDMWMLSNMTNRSGGWAIQRTRY